jgi:cytochrome c-type biogenesis protein
MDAKLALAFSAGMVATVNPCGFALLPAYLSYFLGLDADGTTGTATTTRANPVLRALAVSAAVTAGFLVVFGVMGVLWSSVSGVIGRRLPYVTVVIGVGLVVLGVAMLRGFEPTVRLPKLELSRSGRELSSMFLYGVSYAIASLSCTIGVFISIVSTTLERSNFASSLATFVAYGLGMGMTLAILTIAVALARSGILHAFRRVLAHVNRISGVLLILAGTFVGYYAWVEIQELNGGSTSGVVRWTRDLQSTLQNWVERTGATRLALGALIVIAAAVAVTAVVRRPGPGAGGGPGTGPVSTDEDRADQPLQS